MKKSGVFRLLSALAILWSALPGAAATDNELVFGVFPFLTPAEMVGQFAPLRNHIAKTLERPTSMVSAPDFRSFVERTKKGEYDVIFTAPHMGRLAEKRDGYRLIAQTGYQISVVIIARKQGDIRSLDDLRGHSIAAGQPISLTYQIIDQVLRKRKLLLGTDVRSEETLSYSHAQLTQALRRKDVDAGVTGTFLWEAAPEEQRREFIEIFRTPAMPGLLLLAHRRMGEAALAKLRAAVMSFKETPEGVAYFQLTRQVDFRPIDEVSMRRFDPFTAVLLQDR